jgi:hypothetical protein
MKMKNYAYVVCTNQGEPLAYIGPSDHMVVFVASALADHAVLYVDVLSGATEDRARSWCVRQDSQIGYPVWAAMPEDDSMRRLAMHIERDRKEAEEVMNQTIAEAFLAYQASRTSLRVTRPDTRQTDVR